MKRIIIIDDKPDLRASLEAAINSAIQRAGMDAHKVEAWNEQEIEKLHESAKSTNDDDSNADEDILYRIFKGKDDISLVVSDRDLSAFANVQISESAIADACKRLNIPLATYHRRPRATSTLRNFEQAIQIRSYTIAIRNISNLQEAAKQIIDLATGFDFLFSKIEETRSKPEYHLYSPAQLLSLILERPELEYHFAQYAEGPSVGMDVFTSFAGECELTTPEVQNFITKKTAFVIGCWLYNYILNFPGILLNSTSCASFLNLSEESFSQNSKLFERAYYSGPFSQYDQYWWRAELEEIVFEREFDDGFEYVKSIDPSASASTCLTTGKSPAGFYCLINKAPISLEASKGQLSWIPKGANLCRVEKDAYEALASMMSF